MLLCSTRSQAGRQVWNTFKSYSRCTKEVAICGENCEPIGGDFELGEDLGDHGGDVGRLLIPDALLQ